MYFEAHIYIKIIGIYNNKGINAIFDKYNDFFTEYDNLKCIVI